MKTPIDVAHGRIVGYDRERGELLIRAPYTDLITLTRRGYKECTVRLVDSRTITTRQRNSCYVMLKEISYFTGQSLQSTKMELKRSFINEDLCEPEMELFSLSNCSVSMACAFQKYLVRFIIDFEISCRFPLIDFVDDIGAYVYSCAIRKKCCVCGQHAEPHHWDRIGISINRKKSDQTGMRMEPLCRGHHTECHSMLQEEFDEKYKLIPVRIDDTLKSVWGFNGTRKRTDWMDDWDDSSNLEYQNN